MMRRVGSMRSRRPSMVAARCHGSISCPPECGLATDGLEPGAVEKSLGQGMAGERLVEPGDRGRRAGERGGEHHRVGPRSE